LSKKKEEFLKKKSILKEIPDIAGTTEEVEETKSTPEVEEVPYGNSFGQSAGLKDDLDVEDDGIGINKTNIIRKLARARARYSKEGVLCTGEKKRVAFLDLLIECAENGVVLSDEEVREQVDTIMFEVCLEFN